MTNETIQVYWPDAFGDDVVTINAAEFDADIHTKAEDGKPEEKKATGKAKK